jgi:hypothetical protein
MITVASFKATISALPFRALTLALLLLSAAGVRTAAAQDYRSSVGWNAGALWVSSLNAGATRSSVDGGQLDTRKAAPGIGWTTGVQLDHWLWSGVLGLRAGGIYGRHSLGWSNGTREIGSWAGEAAVLVRIFVPEPDQVFVPYVAVGAAGVRYGLGKGPASTFPEADAYHPGRQSIEWAGSAGLGLDIISPWGWDESPIVLRIEAGNQVAPRSPLRSLESAKRFQFVHNARFTVGLHAGLGSLGERAVPPPPAVRVVAGEG